ncbi:hypothetical protein CIG75_04070 [Tumebacillus algifaecis]|uniref:histidine kinase n=1 Tax=Tumebacillus algifaecis TaxID=1214604 RepID=A0A223CXX1_9BACL|nr:GAF domain-containing sensor histidine kinase [Tumebacillus algifaecis]ASS74240.1 hypothetical protein CIG75_04070 [Tumebacillus algifaecis]
MELIQKFLNKQFFWICFLGSIGAIYAMRNATLMNIDYLIVLTFFLLVIEAFPIKVGRLLITFSFSLLYAMILNTGYEATALISASVMIVVQSVNRRSWKAMLFNLFVRISAVVGSGWTVAHFLPYLPGTAGDFWFEMTQMLTTLLIFSFLSVLIFFWYSQSFTHKHYRNLVFKLTAIDLIVSIVYTWLMIYLLLTTNVGDLGLLGLVFYFLPLGAVSVLLHLFNNLTRAKQSLVTLFEVSRSISQQQSLPTVLEQVIERATEMVGGHCGVLYLLEEGELRRKVCTCGNELNHQKIPPGVSIAWAVALSGKAELVHDVERDVRFWPGETLEGTRTLLVMPIIIADKVVGVISLGKGDSYSFVFAELQVMEVFASHAAVAMKNALYMVEREKRLLVEERNRLAREIHDGIAQDLASAIFQLEMLKRKSGNEEMSDEVIKLQEMLRQTATTLRHSIYSLRPAPYLHAGLGLAMRSYLEEVEKTHGLRFQFDATDLTLQVAPEVMNAVYQVFGESVQNVIKHARATQISVRLSVTQANLQLIVRDDGIGFHFGQAMLEAVNRHSFGIENLHLLADQTGGTLEYNTAPGQGTEIMLEIPLKEERIDDGTHRAL